MLQWALCSATRSCATLYDPMDCSPPGSSVPEIFQARILEWVSISFSRGSPQARAQTCVSSTGRQILYHWAPWEVLCIQGASAFSEAAMKGMQETESILSILFVCAMACGFQAVPGHVGSEFPDQASNQCPLDWKQGVLSTGPPSPIWGFLNRRNLTQGSRSQRRDGERIQNLKPSKQSQALKLKAMGKGGVLRASGTRATRHGGHCLGSWNYGEGCWRGIWRCLKRQTAAKVSPDFS